MTTELVPLNSDIFNTKTPEFFINMKPKDIPDKGSRDRRAFIEYETQKGLAGVNINGIFIPPTLYWHLNHWKIKRDMKDNNGIISPKPSNPVLRDNDWIIHHALWDCEKEFEMIDGVMTPKEKQALVQAGARQIGKSVNMSSIIGHDLSLIDNCNDLLVCSNAGDITVMLNYIFYGMENCTEFFRVPRITKDKKSQFFEFGYKDTDNNSIVKSALYSRNTQGGVMSEVGAGVTIYRAVLDEIAKNPTKAAYTAIKPALRSKFGYRSSPILTFTGGDVEKSKDAESIFRNPANIEAREFEFEGKKGGLFLGGWYRQDLKNETTLGDYLHVSDKNSELYDIIMEATDFDVANARLDAEEAESAKSPDPVAHIKQIIYHPRKVDQMFLTPDRNPFNITELQRQKEYLLENPIGTAVELYRDVHGVVKHKLSTKKPIHVYPIHENTIVDEDAPIMIYDFPKYTDHYDLHIIGCDPYNQDKTITSKSLGSVYGFRRMHTDLTDNFQRVMVFSYTARPDRLRDFFKNLMMLQEFYNGQILFEHSGSPLLQYFEERHKAMHLMDTYSIQKEMNPRSNTSVTKGVKANPTNNDFRKNITIDYLEEELGDGKLGYSRLLDPLLIDELIAYDGDKNVDRYDAFSYGLVHLYAKQKYNTRPFIVSEDGAPEPVKPRTVRKDAFGHRAQRRKTAFG